MNGGIYAITHIASGRLYIGSAIDIRRRWWQHQSRLRLGNHHSPKLQAVWNKHGEDAFSFDIVEVVGVSAALIDREQYWIDLHGACGPAGFNMRPLAGSSLGRKEDPSVTERRSIALRGRMLTTEHKEKIAKAGRGRVLSDETRACISAALIGKKRTKPMSQETRYKMSLARKGVLHGPMSEEQKLKLSTANRGKTRGPMSAAQRAAISAAKLGRAYGPRKRVEPPAQ